jgi:hypothetical protein
MRSPRSAGRGSDTSLSDKRVVREMQALRTLGRAGGREKARPARSLADAWSTASATERRSSKRSFNPRLNSRSRRPDAIPDLPAASHAPKL